MTETAWWEKRWFLALVILASAIPLLFPETPPLVDVPGHMGRFRVQLDLANSPDLQRYFEFQWALIGNLGVDLLIIPLAPLFGLELAVKVIVIAIPVITAAGIFWVAKEVHGRIPPTALFALPFIYGFPFNFGFLNFSLSIALALNAFALWLRLTSQSRFRLRNMVFVPIGCALWVVHAFGWGVLGLLAFAAELVRVVDFRIGLPRALVRATAGIWPLAFPLILMAAWHTGSVPGETKQFFDIASKLYSLVAVLRDRWLIWDSFGVAAAIVLIVAAIFERHFHFSRKLVIPAVVLALAFVIIPSTLLGSAYADVRMGPLMLITAILAIRVDYDAINPARRVALIGLAFVAIRLAGNTASFALADREARAWLTALDHIPRGAKVLFLVGDLCGDQWAMPRELHLASFVIIRRHGFANDQWQYSGAQLLRIHYRKAGNFTDDRSVFVTTSKCLAQKQLRTGKIQTTRRMTRRALSRFPRDGFDYVWIVRPGDFDMRARTGLTPIWRTNDAVLYRLDHERLRPN